MKEIIVFAVGAVTGAAAATLFTGQIRFEIKLLTNKFNILVLRAEDAVKRLEAKL